MKKMYSLLLAALPLLAISQNVGININTPQTPLHIRTHTANGIRVETAPTNSQASLELRTSPTGYDQLEVYKYATGASGTVSGIPLSGLSSVTSGVDAQGGFLAGTLNDHPFYFVTNNNERLRITNTGDFGMGTGAPAFKFHMLTTSGEAGLGLQNDHAAGQSLLNLGYGARGSGNGLALIKYGPSVPGNAYGIPRANLSLVTSDYGGGALVVGTGNNSPLHFGTNSSVNMQIKPGGNVGIGVNASEYTRLYVRRTVNLISGPSGPVGSIFAENGSDIDGSGVFAISFAPRTGANGFAGLTGHNLSSSTDRFGVIGVSSGTSAPAALSAGVGGYGDNGVLGWTESASGAGVVAQHANGNTALEVNNGNIKVSGTNRPAFKHLTTAGNTSGNLTLLSYANAHETDLLFVTHDYGTVGPYLNKPYGVWWDGTHWTIYLEDSSAMALNVRFNVLVIKQQ